MSHYCVYVFHDKNVDIGELLAPYSENIVLDVPVVAYTKEQAIALVRSNIEHTKTTQYAEYLKDPIEYERKYSYNPDYINYIRYEIPKMVYWTDEECYEYEKSLYEPDMVDADGNLLTTYNPKSKWDWYVTGGRWRGLLFGRNEMRFGDIDLEKLDCPYAFVTPAGEWVERGSVGWFGTSSNEESCESWESRFKEYINGISDKELVVTVVDCHI